MLWIAIPLLLACVFVFLWHPSFCGQIKKRTKYYFIVCTTILALCLYGFYGSPLLSDHPFIRLEALSHPQLYSENTDLNSLIKAVQENPSRAVSWKNLADYYLEHRHYYESTLYYQEAWRQDPTNIDLKILYTYSLVLLHNGQLTPTTRTLLGELRKVPKLPFILEMLLKNQP